MALYYIVDLTPIQYQVKRFLLFPGISVFHLVLGKFHIYYIGCSVLEIVLDVKVTNEEDTGL